MNAMRICHAGEARERRDISLNSSEVTFFYVHFFNGCSKLTHHLPTRIPVSSLRDEGEVS
ncbi:protein of unknown function [Paraburkholderia dioscoreae]|uniref:Uncharacterized protein n=1 Tax=Paraburkholderia dioscoreae TaxID=2604047 RepID=A0A5Q4ZN85_9BURK|nr:protein of unknown function [Paraburkholderia dioscoreae]